eukprot:g6456.t1
MTKVFPSSPTSISSWTIIDARHWCAYGAGSDVIILVGNAARVCSKLNATASTNFQTWQILRFTEVDAFPSTPRERTEREEESDVAVTVTVTAVSFSEPCAYRHTTGETEDGEEKVIVSGEAFLGVSYSNGNIIVYRPVLDVAPNASQYRGPRWAVATRLDSFDGGRVNCISWMRGGGCLLTGGTALTLWSCSQGLLVKPGKTSFRLRVRGDTIPLKFNDVWSKQSFKDKKCSSNQMNGNGKSESNLFFHASFSPDSRLLTSARENSTNITIWVRRGGVNGNIVHFGRQQRTTSSKNKKAASSNSNSRGDEASPVLLPLHLQHSGRVHSVMWRDHFCQSPFSPYQSDPRLKNEEEEEKQGRKMKPNTLLVCVCGEGIVLWQESDEYEKLHFWKISILRPDEFGFNLSSKMMFHATWLQRLQFGIYAKGLTLSKAPTNFLAPHGHADCTDIFSLPLSSQVNWTSNGHARCGIVGGGHSAGERDWVIMTLFDEERKAKLLVWCLDGISAFPRKALNVLPYGICEMNHIMKDKLCLHASAFNHLIEKFGNVPQFSLLSTSEGSDAGVKNCEIYFLNQDGNVPHFGAVRNVQIAESCPKLRPGSFQKSIFSKDGNLIENNISAICEETGKLIFFNFSCGCLQLIPQYQNEIKISSTDVVAVANGLHHTFIVFGQKSKISVQVNSEKLEKISFAQFDLDELRISGGRDEKMSWRTLSVCIISDKESTFEINIIAVDNCGEHLRMWKITQDKTEIAKPTLLYTFDIDNQKKDKPQAPITTLTSLDKNIFRSHSRIIFATGHEDGSIHLWEKERNFNNSQTTKNSLSCALSFSTKYVSTSQVCTDPSAAFIAGVQRGQKIASQLQRRKRFSEEKEQRLNFWVTKLSISSCGTIAAATEGGEITIWETSFSHPEVALDGRINVNNFENLESFGKKNIEMSWVEKQESTSSVQAGFNSIIISFDVKVLLYRRSFADASTPLQGRWIATSIIDSPLSSPCVGLLNCDLHAIIATENELRIINFENFGNNDNDKTNDAKLEMKPVYHPSRLLEKLRTGRIKTVETILSKIGFILCSRARERSEIEKFGLSADTMKPIDIKMDSLTDQLEYDAIYPSIGVFRNEKQIENSKNVSLKKK